MDTTFRIFDFNFYNQKADEESASDEESNVYKDTQTFMIQMFGLNEQGKTCSIYVEEFKPFFYVMVNDSWSITEKKHFLEHIKTKMGKFYF